MAARRASGKPESSKDEAELFHQAAGEVKPVHNNQAVIKKTPPIAEKTVPAATSDDRQVEYGEALEFLRPGIQVATLRKLRRGKFPIEDTLDLHGLTADKADKQLRLFLQEAQAAGIQAVRIIHGKGHGSPGRQPLLKTMVNQQLSSTVAVLAFCSARQEHGGIGAVDVLLRKTGR